MKRRARELVKRRKRESRRVVEPPSEALSRVNSGGPWGPTQFDLPDHTGRNTQAILIVTLIGVVVLLILAALWLLAYHQFT